MTGQGISPLASAALANAALVGLALSVFTWVWARLARRRSAEDRCALWALGLAAVMVGSAATLFVKPLRVAIELPRMGRLALPVNALPFTPNLHARTFVSGAQIPVIEIPVRRSGEAARASILAAIERSAVDLWAMVAGALFIRWLLGYLSAFRIRQRSTELDPRLRARLDLLLRRRSQSMLPAIRSSGAVKVPLTVSLLRCTILLPSDAPGWSDERLLAVMAHELAHVERRDGLLRSMALLCAVMHWFNPLVWLAAARLEEAQEIAADDAILDAGIRPSSCARELLAIAEGLTLHQSTPLSGLPMIEAGSLMARLSLILGPARSHKLSARLVAGAGLAFAVLTAGVVSLRATASFADPMTARQRGAPMVRAANDGGFYETAMAGTDAGALLAASDGSMVIAGGQERPAGIATDETSVYWTNFEGGTLTKAPLGGGSPTTLISGQRGPQSLAVRAGRVYWTNFEGGTVMRMPLSGNDAEVLASGQDHPSGLALDSTRLYWVNSDGRVRAVPLEGGELATLGTGVEVAPPAARSIAVDSAYVYWTEGGQLSKSNGRILRAPLSGGPVTALAEGQDNPCRLALDGESVYWTNLGTWANRLIDGTVMKIPKQGGTPIVLAAGQLQPLGIALDGENLYWTRAPIDEVSQGIVMRMPRSGGRPSVAAWQQHRPSNIVASARGVYWTNGDDGSVRMLKAVGGGSSSAGTRAGSAGRQR